MQTVLYVRSMGMSRMLNNLTFRICDGYPLSKAINFLYGLNQERVDGFNLFIKRYPRALTKIQSIIFLGMLEEVVLKMIKELKETYPGINIVGYHCPPIQEISKFKKVLYRSSR